MVLTPRGKSTSARASLYTKEPPTGTSNNGEISVWPASTKWKLTTRSTLDKFLEMFSIPALAVTASPTVMLDGETVQLVSLIS